MRTVSTLSLSLSLSLCLSFSLFLYGKAFISTNWIPLVATVGVEAWSVLILLLLSLLLVSLISSRESPASPLISTPSWPFLYTLSYINIYIYIYVCIYIDIDRFILRSLYNYYSKVMMQIIWYIKIFFLG